MLSIVGKILPKHFPRGIFNQLFYGSIIVEYKMYRIERVTLFALTILLFLLGEAYLAKLFQFMFNYQYEPHSKSVEDLLSSSYTIQAEEPFYRTHLEITFPQLKGQIEQTTVEAYFRTCDTAKVLVLPCHYALFLTASKENVDPNTGFLKYYVLPERVPLLTNAYTHSRVQPFSRRFTTFYAELHEAGLLEHWFEASKADWLSIAESRLDLVKFEHLFSLWKLLATGFGVAGLVFIVELMWNWLELQKGFSALTIMHSVKK